VRRISTAEDTISIRMFFSLNSRNLAPFTLTARLRQFMTIESGSIREHEACVFIPNRSLHESDAVAETSRVPHQRYRIDRDDDILDWRAPVQNTRKVAARCTTIDGRLESLEYSALRRVLPKCDSEMRYRDSERRKRPLDSYSMSETLIRPRKAA
jgi:hypothetical protein